MSRNRFTGLLMGLMIALLTVGVAASGASPNGSARESLSPLPETRIADAPPGDQPTATPPTSTPVPSPTSAATLASTPITPPPAANTAIQTASPTQTPTEASPEQTEHLIGYSVEGRPISAYRVGQGPLKVVLIGDIHGEFEANTHRLAEQLADHFLAHPGEVPANLSLWIIPTMNPDGLATGHRWNANDVDLNRNADTDLDGCAGNDWSPDTEGLEGPHPGAGGAYPFSEPEARAVRDFLHDAWIAVFYHSAAEAIFADTCQRHLPSARLAEILSAGTGYEVPEEGWAGYRITGEFGDYLAGEGVAAVTVELTDKEDPEFERNLAGVQALLARVDEIVAAEARAVGADFIWLDGANTGAWQYEEGSILHPLALEVIGGMAYLLDGGRVLVQDLSQPQSPRPILTPGDYVESVRVLEPLDLATAGQDLLALDRAGDVYRFDPAGGTWTLERYDRPVGDTSDHYFVALTGGEGTSYLLETTHEQVWRFDDGKKGSAWLKLPQGRDVDVSARGGDVYILTRSMNNPRGSLLLYQEGKKVSAFQPNVDLMHPRQIVATEVAVYVLDRAGRRLLALDPKDGALLALHQFTDRQDVGAIWADATGTQLILAGRDALHFYGEPEQVATIEGGPLLTGPQPHDLDLLEELRGLSMPIAGATLTRRDFQMPGAPRHYRLGVHEGIDFYEQTVSVTVNRRTPVRAVADGVVVRALLDYRRLTAAQNEVWYAKSLSLGYTPPDVLDGYRGRQIWIDHGNGVVSRYAHLGSIAEGIVEGAKVTQGQVIATVGNSGTPSSVSSETVEVHLHLELWVGDCATVPSESAEDAALQQCHFVGQFLRPIEAREWLEKILR